MAGHSRWAQVKHKKAGADARRSALFSKLGRLIAAAAREGGADPAANAKLRAAVDQARSAGLPKDNIDRAIARADGANAAALVSRDYEAYGPGGSAFLIQTVTDNPNRTTNDLKAILTDHGGKLAAAGSVAWQFERASIAAYPLPAPEEQDAATMALIDAGATDIDASGKDLLARVPPESLEAFLRAAARAGLVPEHTETLMAARSTVALDAAALGKARALMDALEDHPDVTTVYNNIQP
ncbi:MAG: YebC/PmpR family DNA-binding transcriptional regulator [Candidatus Sungbacteria bacterium]|uniref:Probable transcriptional regulatory protein HY474_00740 n=1 Tax=Candidatus Sungiibacteriota bacterium TaxID=2750080 RepID=A0A932YY52_9BACT|nr:YebC/PmpR family DNA-binding transcriptional regulator [Candidatus Sungbacteria bacterium]